MVSCKIPLEPFILGLQEKEISKDVIVKSCNRLFCCTFAGDSDHPPKIPEKKKVKMIFNF